ncbi:SH3 domain-containing protein [Priestia megaterium]|uniref:SH3 domain-containing protein n=1 Tax=Priestia megaterium TaxID=1404 RepID=UPI002E201C81|nr:SH3 domain-containing protein [Priestia megaterium]
MTEVNRQTFYKKLVVTGLAFTLVGAGTLGLHSSKFMSEPTVANAAAETYTTTANLNIRSGPSTANAIVATVKQGTQLTVVGQASSGWLKVSYQGKTGYVSSQYVKKSVSSTTKTYVTTANLNIRSGPSTSNAIVVTVKQGTQLTATGEPANGWLKVSYQGKTGYVNTQYVKESTGSSETDPASSVYVATANLNVRTTSSTSGAVIATLKAGTQIDVTAKEANGWLKITYQGKVGYVSGQYVRALAGMKVVSNPESIQVVVNKQNKLPENYVPKDLVYTTIPFTFKEQTEKKKMRSEAAAAIAQLFAGAKKQGVTLLGVSAYRSHATQSALFSSYVQRDGYDKAATYSALPGTSEHETGLGIDVTKGDGTCAAQDCFGGTKEATWLDAHAAEYGFIIRYPKGKDAVTGYKYEPWHLRYVGKPVAQAIKSKGITLEEYYGIK